MRRTRQRGGDALAFAPIILRLFVSFERPGGGRRTDACGRGGQESMWLRLLRSRFDPTSMRATADHCKHEQHGHEKAGNALCGHGCTEPSASALLKDLWLWKHVRIKNR